MGDRFRRRLLPILIGIAFLWAALPSLRYVVGSPSHIRLIIGEEQDLKFRIPLSLSVTPPEKGSVLINDSPISNGNIGEYKTPVTVTPQSVGSMTMDLKLFGILPIRKMVVDVIPSTKVIPGGQAIGVLLTSEGVMVIAHTSLEDTEGNRRYPAEEAGIEVGDVILRINGEEIKNSTHVSQLVEKYSVGGKPRFLDIRRGKKTVVKELHPVLTRVEQESGGSTAAKNAYKMGLYIEDNVAGVGTMTFYSPENRRYAALGHVITDASTSQKIKVKEGRIVRADISGIQQGLKGQPGEKIGTFEGSDIVGNIEKNTDFGIYGQLERFPEDRSANKPIPIAVASQIKTGPAEILTVIQDHRVERFQVEIQRVFKQDKPQTKGLIIKVTDPRLLRRTGGIIQGMSGSPIIQNGRLIGAVTHVFVNDPTRGYGVLAEWMVMEAGLVDEKPKRSKSDAA
jgi:stage IV sporulation protein B